MPSADLARLGAFLGAGLSMGLGAIGAAYGLGLAAGEGAKGMARQPHVSGNILKTMLIGQAVTESPALFSLIVSIMLLFTPLKGEGWLSFFAAVSAGICMGSGALGPGIGAGLANAGACEGVSINPDKESVIMRMMLVGQAVSQSTSIYALVIALLLIMV